MRDRRLILWGGGRACIEYLEKLPEQSFFEAVLDNDPKKTGNNIGGLTILHPTSIQNWHQFFVVITVAYFEVSEQLNRLGLEKGKDYCLLPEYVGVNFYDGEVQLGLKDIIVDNKESEIEIIIRNREEYENIIEKYNYLFTYQDAIEKMYRHQDGNVVLFNGYCNICNKKRKFSFDIAHDGHVQWRESGIDFFCNCNSRNRYVYRYLMQRYKRNEIVYISEQVTPLYRSFKQAVDILIGSEYLGSQYEGGEYINGIRHEDATNLSFKSSSLDYMIYCDIFEHIPNYLCAIQEAFRCLKNGGRMLISIPFFARNDKNVVRAQTGDQGIRHILPPVYHGDPVSSEGILVYTDFGWEFLDEIKSVGFRQAYAIFYYSIEYALFSTEPAIVFEGIK